MQLGDTDNVRCATYMFRDDARIWWDRSRSAVNLAKLSWAGFKEVFYGKYFTADNQTRLAREFLELRQGSMSMDDYVKFERGRYFVPLIVGQPQEELWYFVED